MKYIIMIIIMCVTIEHDVLRIFRGAESFKSRINKYSVECSEG